VPRTRTSGKAVQRQVLRAETLQALRGGPDSEVSGSGWIAC